MESSTSIATSSLKALNFLSPPSTPTKPRLVTIFQIPKKTNRLSLPRCSTKPDTNIGDQDSTFGNNIGPDPRRPDSSKPDSTDELPTLSSPLPSSSPSSSSNGGLIFDLGVGNSWDSSEIGSPVVKRFLSDDEERWYMWYHGRPPSPGSDSVGLAVSSNGVHWQRGGGPVQTSRDVGSVMGPGRDWWGFDTLGVRPAEVVVMSSSKVRASSAVYWMYYTGFGSDEAPIAGDDSSEPRFDKSLPGLAISQDGRYWARIEGEHHSGALFDVGSEKDWDSLFVASPRVVFHGNGDLRMYYYSFDLGTGKFSVGVARSRDGIRWVKLGKAIFGGGGQSGNFDELGALNPHVVKTRDGKYLMAYEGVGPNGERSIGLAESRDGLKEWARIHDDAVLKAQEGLWDQGGVGSPCLVQMDGEEDEWRLYYRGVGSSEGRRTGIGMAISYGSDVTRFRRWSGFHV